MPTITFAAGTTSTINNFSAVGTSVNPITIQSDSEYLRATISKSLPNTTMDYCYLKNMIFTGDATFKAIHSVDLGGNLGVTFINVTLSDVLSDIDTRLPNKFTSTQKLGWLNDVQRKVWRYFTDEVQVDFDTIADQGSYPIPNDLKFENIKQVIVSNSTVNFSSTNLGTQYELSGYGDLDGRTYNYFKDNNRIGLYPIPEYDSYKVRIKYIPKPINLASTDVEIRYFNEDYLDALKYGVMATIAKAGNNPDIELANNYTADYNEILRQAQFDTARRRSKLAKNIMSYKEGWDD